MAQGNGSDSSAAHSLPGYTTFIIGGKPERVPPLTFWTLEARKPELDTVDSDMTLYAYTDVVLRLVATSIEATAAGEDEDPKPENIERTFKRLKRRIIFGEMKMLAAKMDELYLNSGFSPPGEVQAASQAASPGTGTSTDSPLTSQSEESAEETPSGSSESLH